MLSPEERKLNYRAIAVRHQQHRVMDHIFGDKSFELKQLDEVCNWMRTTKAEEEFVNSRLIAKSKKEGKNVELSDSTIASLSRSMQQLMKFVIKQYSDSDVKSAAERALDALKCIEANASKLQRKQTQCKGFLEPENYLVSLDDLRKFLDSKVHNDVISKAMGIFYSEEDSMDYAKANYSRKEVFQLQCHVAVLLTMHTGKRPGLLCGIKIHEIDRNTDNVKKFTATSTPGESSYQFKVTPECVYAVFKTVAVAFVNVSQDMMDLLTALGYLKINIDKASVNDQLFTSFTDLELLDIDRLMKKAWTDAGLRSAFTSTMIRHTIVTRSRDPENKLDEDQIKALARGMDHSVRIAESTYQHEKEKMAIDHSLIIQKILKLNGVKTWNDELKEGIEEDIEKKGFTGELELIPDEKDKDEEEEGETNTDMKKRKVGNMEVIFSKSQTELVKRMFSDYIDDKIANPKKSVYTMDILGIVIQFISLLLHNF